MSKRIPLSLPSRLSGQLMRDNPFVARLLARDPELRSRRSQEEVADYCNLSALRRGLRPGDPDWVSTDDFIWISHWARCKQVYRIDREVAIALGEQPLAAKVPCEALSRLPYPTVYIDSPVETPIGEAKGVMAFASPEVPLRDGARVPPSMTLVVFYADGRRSMANFFMAPGSTLKQAYDQARRFSQTVARCLGDGSETRWALDERSFASAVNLLLYVNSEEADARVVYEPPRESRGQKVGRRTNPERIVELGARMGRAIGDARRASSSGREGDGGRTLAPHMRRAHWQHFWVGQRKGRADGRFGDELILRWVPPVAVNADGSPATEVVHGPGRGSSGSRG